MEEYSEYLFERVYTVLDILGIDRRDVDYYRKLALDEYLTGLGEPAEDALDRAYNQGHEDGYDEGYEEAEDEYTIVTDED